MSHKVGKIILSRRIACFNFAAENDSQEPPEWATVSRLKGGCDATFFRIACLACLLGHYGEGKGDVVVVGYRGDGAWMWISFLERNLAYQVYCLHQKSISR
jgi:hypothetical protein